jgi:hypothetical protein
MNLGTDTTSKQEIETVVPEKNMNVKIAHSAILSLDVGGIAWTMWRRSSYIQGFFCFGFALYANIKFRHPIKSISVILCVQNSCFMKIYVPDTCLSIYVDVWTFLKQTPKPPLIQEHLLPHNWPSSTLARWCSIKFSKKNSQTIIGYDP